MTTDGISPDGTFFRDQLERSQLHQTRRRRDDRSRRRRIYLLCGVGLIALLVLGAPSLLSHSPAGREVVTRIAASYGWEARVKGVRVGWITPLRLDALELRGAAAGTEISIQQLETEMTVSGLLRSSPSDLGQISARGVVMAVKVMEGRSSLEDDLQPLLTGPASEDPYTGEIQLQDIGIVATDVVTDRAWKLSQSNGECELTAEGISAQFAGVLTEPGGSGGALQGSASWNSTNADDVPQWQLRLQCESLPISLVSLVARRVGDAASSIPEEISGDGTGRLAVDGFADGRVRLSPEQIEVRNFAAADPSMGQKLWSNRLATLDGELILEPNRILGRQFQLSTDFATVAMNGAISTALTFAGSSDNPVQWLDALDGMASADVDLAMLDRALPGVLHLRQDAEIVSGSVSARVDTLAADGGGKRSRLTLTSQPIRARTGGQGVVIEPVECVATVFNDRGRVAAEQFTWKSTFANATGKGDLRGGAADVAIDFGRLATTLQPIIDLPDDSLAGNARGKIRWNATTDNLWRLDGSGEATDVRLVLPSGHSFSRPSLRGDVRAVGRWDGQALSELSEANLTIASTGITMTAELTEPVLAPSAETLLPVRVQGNGRVEALADLIHPWLPEQLHDCEGGFDLTARGKLASVGGHLNHLALELTEPRAAYHDRYFTQTNVKVLFDGDYAWPDGDMVAKSLTVAGEAFSAAVQGEATSRRVDLELAWRAKLERIQGSVRSRIAGRAGIPVQTVGFQAGQTPVSEDWLVIGDVDGKANIQQQEDWLEIGCETTGKNLAVVQPPRASAEYQTTGPLLPNRSRGAGGAMLSPTATSRVVWSEPNFRMDGTLRYRRNSGELLAEGLNVSGDWFAAKLSGRGVSTATESNLKLRGPGRLKMDEVAQRLSQLTGTPIVATGIQESPFELTWQQASEGPAKISLVGNLGWESAEIGGVALGPTSVPVTMTETTVFVSPAVIPLAQGQINVAGEVYYRPGPIWFRVKPGPFAQSVRLTREMNERWLKYLAPLAADAAQIDGTLGVTFDEAIVVLDSPEKSRVIGRLDIERVEMTSGPLASQIIGGVEQLKALARGTLPQTTPGSSKTLVTMPAQTVDFALYDGYVSHQRLFFDVDRARVVTSGRVALDGRLNLVAQVPLDARWLGRDLQGLAGRTVNLPIDGTLSRPSLDSAGVRQMVSQLGVQAAQGAAENYLKQQFDRSLEKILGN